MYKTEYKPRYDMYNEYKIRELSFNYYWGTNNSKKRLVMEMADAGFFYYGNNPYDEAACFSCGGVIEDWEIYDNPWMQHAINFPQCFYLNAVKGGEYINKWQNVVKNYVSEKSFML